MKQKMKMEDVKKMKKLKKLKKLKKRTDGAGCRRRLPPAGKQKEEEEGEDTESSDSPQVVPGQLRATKAGTQFKRADSDKVENKDKKKKKKRSSKSLDLLLAIDPSSGDSGSSNSSSGSEAEETFQRLSSKRSGKDKTIRGVTNRASQQDGGGGAGGESEKTEEQSLRDGVTFKRESKQRSKTSLKTKSKKLRLLSRPENSGQGSDDNSAETEEGKADPDSSLELEADKENIQVTFAAAGPGTTHNSGRRGTLATDAYSMTTVKGRRRRKSP